MHRVTNPVLLAVLLVLWCLLGASPLPAVGNEASDRAPGAEVYLQLADEIETHLLNDVLPLWYPRCVDRERGGFYSNFREDWSFGDRQHKTIVFQSRLTWLVRALTQ